MAGRGSFGEVNDLVSPLSSLRLLVPPLRLLSAAMWQSVKQKDVTNYWKLQELVLQFTEEVPGLMGNNQRAQLILGLRARLILELCRETSRGSFDTQTIHQHLARFPITPTENKQKMDAQVEATQSTFVELVQSLLKDPTERAYFFQEIFPVEYGQKFDAAIQTLLWECLSKIEKFFPIPDLKQTAAWLDAAPSVLDECVQSTPLELKFIYQHHKSSLKMQFGPNSTTDTASCCIMSALSIPPSQGSTTAIGLQSIHNYANLLNPISFVRADQYGIVTFYTEVVVGASGVGEEIAQPKEEVYMHSIMSPSEIVVATSKEECVDKIMSVPAKANNTDDSVNIATALETLTKTFALKKDDVPTQEVLAVMVGESNTESICSDLMVENMETATSKVINKVSEQKENDFEEETKVEETQELMEDCASSWTQAEGMDKQTPIGSNEELDTSSEATVYQTEHTVQNVRSSARLQLKAITSGQQKHLSKMSVKKTDVDKKMNSGDVSIAPSVIAIRGIHQSDKKDESGEMTSIIFTCPLCPFHNADVHSPPHIHIQNIRTEEYKTLMAAKLNGEDFTPSPCSTDMIFTSIKLFPTAGNIETEDDNIDTTDNDVAWPYTHGKQKSLTCETCGKTFTRTSDVRRHQLTHTGERPFHCSECDRTFQHSWDLAKHESKHHGKPVSFPCQQCGSSFANLRALTFHHKKAHPGESELPQICSICSQSFPSSSELLEHRRTHGASLNYICQQCGEGFESLLARSQHRQTHLVKHQFKCPHCDKTYTRRADVKRHLATHTGERPYQCNQCNKRFSLRFMLIKHLKVHTGERPFQCSHCPKRFTLVSILTRHERMHTGEKPFLCSQCGKCFLSQGELSKHHRSHVDDRPYSCNLCEKRFKSKKAQQEHIFSHTGARPYPCTYCGKGFTKPYALTRHHLIHTGERPFPCAYCGKTFLTLGEAQLHGRIHTGERPYPCPICELKFKSSSELARHRRCHSGTSSVKPYCEQCMKSFPSKAKLKIHLESHAETEKTKRSSPKQNE